MNEMFPNCHTKEKVVRRMRNECKPFFLCCFELAERQNTENPLMVWVQNKCTFQSISFVAQLGKLLISGKN